MKIPIKDIWFVLLQFALFVLYAFEVEAIRIVFPVLIFWVGVVMLISGAFITVVAVLQLNVHLSPFPSPLPGAKLIENGVYKFIRHPIYLGIMAAFFGFAIIADSGFKLIVTTLLLILFYYKTRYEEKRLLAMFPKYLEYKQRSGRFFPKLW